MALTYRVRMLVYNRQNWPDPVAGPTRVIETRFAGCIDAEDARRKARAIYAVAAFKLVEPIEKEE